MSFWAGFEKRAGIAGQISGLGHFGSQAAGRLTGAKPSAMMATASAFKPGRIPSATTAPAKAALAPKIQTQIPEMPRQHARGVSSTVI